MDRKKHKDEILGRHSTEDLKIRKGIESCSMAEEKRKITKRN